jgi:hypothetical protein
MPSKKPVEEDWGTLDRKMDFPVGINPNGAANEVDPNDPVPTGFDEDDREEVSPDKIKRQGERIEITTAVRKARRAFASCKAA